MGIFPISLVSISNVVRGLIRRASSSRRLYVVPALALRTNPTISHSEQVENTMKEGKASDLNEIGLLRDDLYLALSFLNRLERNWTLPSVQAYASIIRIVYSWGLDQKLDPLFVELIRKGDELRGFSVSDLLEAIGEAEEDEGKGSSLLLSRLSCSLVRAYANLNMFDEAINTCYYPGSNPDVKTLNFLMNRMIASGKYDMAVSCFCQFVRPGLDADADKHTYVLLVQAYRKVVRRLCDEMKIDAAETVVLDMEKRGIAQDVYVYSAIIEGHRKNMNFLKALHFFFDKVAPKGKSINCVIASSILQCCCQMRKFSEAYDLFLEFRDKNISLDRVCYNVAFDALGKLGKVEEAIKLFREMIGKGMAPDIINYTTLIGGCCLHGKIPEARDLIIEMQGTGKALDSFAYSVLASGLARQGCALYALRTLDVMEDRGVKPTSFTHSMVIEGLFVAGKIDEAEDLYERLEHKSQENAASMVKGYCEAGRVDQAFELLAKLEFPLPKNLYLTLFTSLCAKDDYIDKAQYLLDRMYKVGVEPEKSMFGKLIAAWCRVNDVRKARQIFNVLVSSRKIIPDLFTYTIMINTYCRLNELKEAYALFQDMKQRRIIPDVVTYTVLLNHNPELDMKSEMKALGIERDVVYYTVLIDRQCKIGDLQEAERIFREMIENGVEPDVVPYTALIAACCRNGSVRKAVTLMQEMLEKGIKPTEASKNLVAYRRLKAKRLRSQQ